MAVRIIELSNANDRYVRGIYPGDMLIGILNVLDIAGTTIELGWIIAPAQQGRGHATDAVRAAIDDLFSKGYLQVLAGAFEENAANIRVIALKETGSMIGEIVVMPNDGCFSTGYTFHYNYHRRGYAFEALHTLTELLHQCYPEMEFIGFTEPENTASRKLLEKLDYRYMGYVPQLTSQIYGKWLQEQAPLG